MSYCHILLLLVGRDDEIMMMRLFLNQCQSKPLFNCMNFGEDIIELEMRHNVCLCPLMSSQDYMSLVFVAWLKYN